MLRAVLSDDARIKFTSSFMRVHPGEPTPVTETECAPAMAADGSNGSDLVCVCIYLFMRCV